MICKHCGELIGETETYCKAGLNNTIFCSKKCAYQAFKKFYTKDEVDKTMKIIDYPVSDSKK